MTSASKPRYRTCCVGYSAASFWRFSSALRSASRRELKPPHPPSSTTSSISASSRARIRSRCSIAGSRHRHVGRRLSDRAPARHAVVGFWHHSGRTGKARRHDDRPRRVKKTSRASWRRTATNRPTSPIWPCHTITTIIRPVPTHSQDRRGWCRDPSAPRCSRIHRRPIRSLRTSPPSSARLRPPNPVAQRRP